MPFTIDFTGGGKVRSVNVFSKIINSGSGFQNIVLALEAVTGKEEFCLMLIFLDKRFD